MDRIEPLVLDRKLNRVAPEDTDIRGNRSNPSVLVPKLRQTQVYVLLGDPNAGKTTVFTQEAAFHQTSKIRVGEFLNLNTHANSDTPIFIDGLDEALVSTKGGLQQIREIARKWRDRKSVV